MKRLITKAQFARMAKINEMTANRLCSGALSAAIVDGKVDRDHEDVLNYLRDTATTPPPPPPLPDFTLTINTNGLPPTDYLAGTEIDGLGDMTLRELANKFGTVAQLIDWLNARKKLVDISEKEIKNAKLREELIPRAYVSNFIIAQFERTNMNLLNDAPKTISSELLSLFKGGGTLEEATTIVEGIISTHLQAGKDYVKRMIERA